MIHEVFIKTGKFMFPVNVCTTDKRIFFKYGFNAKITEEIKAMEGVQFHGYDGAPNRELARSIFGSDKVWSVADTQRNRFQFDFLQNKPVYKRWDEYLKNPVKYEFKRDLREHQKDLTTHGLMCKYGIWAAEMGTGKTLSAIELMEKSGTSNWWYVAPKSALRAVGLEFEKWGLKFRPQLMTYNELVKRMKNWVEGQTAPQGVIFDESQKIKTPNAQRSEAARALADGIREDWGENGYVILMSGSPAPKEPIDWWHQCEVAYPGFIREGTVNKFKFRLGLHEQKDSFAGGSFHERLTWLDDEKKCCKCGEYEDNFCHSTINPDKYDHDFAPSINEVAKLYRRMKGLVVVKFKKDCVDLPEKQYRVIECSPLPNVVRAAKLLIAKTQGVAKSLILLRELSDGFQYTEVENGEKDCERCHSSGEIDDWTVKEEYAERYQETGLAHDAETEEDLSDSEYQEKYFNREKLVCPTCAGHGKVTKYDRGIQRIPCPKDDVLRDLLDEHEDVGRLVVYAGFEGSVNRCVEVALAEKWAVIKWDGKGLKIYGSDGTPLRCLPKPPEGSKTNSMDAEGAVEPLTMFQYDFANFRRVCFIGNAGAAGTGLTLTASPSIFYYSNSFNAEDRIQSEDRIHRIGMDENRGATIIDVFHLPTDKYVHDNLKKKRKLQDLSMGELNSVFKEKEDQRLF